MKKTDQASTHIFPIFDEVSYREFRSGISGGVWGEGLLDFKRYGDPRLKAIVLPENLESFQRAELFVFGTGRYINTCTINGTEFALPTLGANACGEEPYEFLGDSVHRSYHSLQIPMDVLRSGINELWFEHTHAFIQYLVIRLFHKETQQANVNLHVNQKDSSYTLSLSGEGLQEVERADFFARHAGMDFDGSSQERTWQVMMNRDLDSEWGYELSNHCGTCYNSQETSHSSWQLDWEPRLVPEGKLEFRVRLSLQDGTVIESPGGVKEVQHDAGQKVNIIKPDKFSPFGYNENGWQQDKSFVCHYDISDLNDVTHAILAVPLYGETKMILNEQHTLTCEAPEGGYYVREIEVNPEWLKEGKNRLELTSTGGTGCYQVPGPYLYVWM